MILFRHHDKDRTFFREDSLQRPARWHDATTAPAQYLSTTPDAAWAEFIRHEGITTAEECEAINRALWAVDVPDEPWATPDLPESLLFGDEDAYPACRAEANRLLATGVRRIHAPSAAVLPRTPSGFRTDGGLRPGPPLHEETVVLFGPRPDVTGWYACAEGRPHTTLLGRVRHFS